jgi:Transglutaminase-like superfamily
MRGTLAATGSSSPAIEGRGSFFTAVADGERGTAKTIRYARRLIAQSLRDPATRYFAVDLLREQAVPGYDEMGEVRGIFNGVRKGFTFRRDSMLPYGGEIVAAEMLQPVSGLLRSRAGDCDCLNLVLLPALLAAIGYPTRAVTIKSDEADPSNFSHVYSEVQLSDGRWIPLDVARPDAAFGLAPDRYWKIRYWPLTGGKGSELRGMGALSTRFTGLSTLHLPGRLSLTPITVVSHARALRGLGQSDGSSFDWSSLLSAIPQDLQGVATIVKASNTPGIAYAGISSSQQQSSLNYGTGSGIAGQPGVSVGLTSTSSPLLIVGLALVAGIVIFKAVKS